LRNGWGPAPICRPAPEGLLAHYAEKPARWFLQLDGWEMADPDDRFMPDEEGHVVSHRLTFDLRSSDCPVRVQIHESASKDTVIALLKKIVLEVENNWDGLVDPPVATAEEVPTF